MNGRAARGCRIFACCAILLGHAGRASAEWQFAPFFGWEFGGHTSFSDFEFASDDTHRGFGLTVTRIGRGIIGVEGTGLYVPGFFNDPKLDNDLARRGELVTSSRVFAIMGNVVVSPPQRWNEYGLRPYVSGGFGLLRADESNDVGATDIHQRLFGANVGGGAVGFLSDRTGLRFDLRFYSNVRNVADNEGVTIPIGSTKHLRFWTGSIGLVLR